MEVTVKYTDNTAFVFAEVERHAKHAFGENTRVSIMPDSNDPEDIIYFGIQQLITKEQLSLIFDTDGTYHKDIKGLRVSTIQVLSDILDKVIIDNEARVC